MPHAVAGTSRIVAALALVAALCTSVLPPRLAPTVSACSPAVPDLASVSSAAGFIALVEVLEVGPSQNPLPTLQPPSSTPAPSPTAEPSAAATPVPLPTDTPSPPREPIDLHGIGARARIIESYVGQPSGEIDLDAVTRLRVARAAREAEALPPGVVTPCPVNLGVPAFEPGHTYLVFASSSGDVVSWATLIARDGSTRYLALEYVFTVPRALADRYLVGIPVQEYAADGSTVLVIADRLPLDTVLAITAAARGDVTIHPPNTGTAGLK